MQSTKHTNTQNAGTVAASLGRRWPVLALGICALLALAILAISAEPAGAAPAGQTANQNPTFPDETATRKVPENSEPTTKVGVPIPAENDAEGDAVYQLDGADKESFEIDRATGQISVGANTILDHETQPTYRVQIQVIDSKDADGNPDSHIDDTAEVTIEVTDVEEPPAKPDAPTVSTADPDGDTTLEVRWTAPANTGPPISGYDLRYSAGNSGNLDREVNNVTGTSTSISNLEPSTTYEVQVRAKNEEGVGDWSDSGTGRTGVAVIACTDLEIDQDEETTPGASVDLTLRFMPRGCDPTGDGGLHDEITITLSEEIAIPSGFDKDDVSLRAARRYELRWAEADEYDDQPHEIVLPGCGDWETGSDDDVCDETGFPVSIELKNLRLPNVPADSDDPYEVTIQWQNGRVFDDEIAVDAALDVDGDDEVGYGETIRFEGLGFSDGLTVDLYAISSTNNNMDCSTAGGGSWTRIGSAEVGSNHRFRADVEVGSSLFRSAGRYWICARDGGGVFNNAAAGVIITAGLEVAGSSEVSPGGEVTLRIVGGSGSRVDEVLVAGQTIRQWNQSGDTLRVTLPPRHSGRVTIAARLDGSSELVTVNITIRDAELTVRPDRGIGLGEQFLVNSNNLAGNEVCEVTLGGIRLAFLEDDQGDVRSRNDCPEVIRGGRFTATAALVNDNGDVNSDLINKLLDSDGEEKLEITDSAGVKASATIRVDKPTLTVVPDEGEVSPRDVIVFRGQNFPVDQRYYSPPLVTLEINGRTVASEYTDSSGSWEYEYRVTSRAEGGESIRPLVKIGGYPLHELTLDLDLVVTPGSIEVNPEAVRIGEPITVRLFGLDRFIGGYSVQIRSGPSLAFDGRASFASDGSGEFVGVTVIPVDYHRDFAEQRDYTTTLQVYQGRDRLPGVVETVTLRPERYVAPTFPPDAPAAPAVAADGLFGLTVTWAEPADDGGAPITDYDVEYSVAGSRVYADAGYGRAGTRHTITELAQGVEYQVRVRANNAAGTSEWSRPTTGATEQLVASIEAAPDTLSVVAGEPAGFRITLSHAADVTVKLTHETDGGFAPNGSGECVITAGSACEYSVATSESQDSDSGSLTVSISPAPEYAVGTPSARVTIQNPAPTPTPVPPTPTPTPEPTPTVEPTATPVPPPPTIDQSALTSTIVAAVTTGETETRDRPVAEEETDGGDLSGLAIGLIVVAVVVVLAVIGGVVTFVMRRRGGGGGAAGGGDGTGQ